MVKCNKEIGHFLEKEGIKPKETGKKSGSCFFAKTGALMTASQVTFVTLKLDPYPGCVALFSTSNV
jgi:hypothetical protein